MNRLLWFIDRIQCEWNRFFNLSFSMTMSHSKTSSIDRSTLHQFDCVIISFVCLHWFQLDRSSRIEIEEKKKKKKTLWTVNDTHEKFDDLFTDRIKINVLIIRHNFNSFTSERTNISSSIWMPIEIDLTRQRNNNGLLMHHHRVVVGKKRKFSHRKNSFDVKDNLVNIDLCC